LNHTEPTVDSDHIKFLSGDVYNYDDLEVGLSYEAFQGPDLLSLISP
jgi:hypothetical protein